MACYLVWEAASMSAHCTWLINAINDLCLEDPAATDRHNFLRAMKSLNSVSESVKTASTSEISIGSTSKYVRYDMVAL